jgi:hypothetical protein
MRAEVSTVVRAVAADYFFNCWCLELSSDNRILQDPRCEQLILIILIILIITIIITP